jgi:hypothetical protein
MAIVHARWNLALAVCFFIAGASLGVAYAQMPTPPDRSASQGGAPAVMVNADVIALMGSRFSQEELISIIRVRPSRFDLSPAGMAALITANVPDAVIAAMVEAARRTPAPVSPAPVVLAPPPAPPPPVQRAAVPEVASTRSVESTRPSRPHVTMKLGGGASTVTVGDFKTVIDASNTYVRSLYSVTGGQKAPPYVGGGGIDIIVHLTRVIGIGTGVGYVWGRQQSSRQMSSSSWNQTLDASVEVSALPVRIGPVITIPFSRTFEAYISVMPAYYIGKIKKDTSWTYVYPTYSTTQHEVLTGKKNGFGAEGALGIKINLSSSFGLFLEGNGRYAKLAKLTGSYDFQSSSSTSTSRTGALTYYEGYQSSTGTWVSYVSLPATPITASSTVRNVRGANLDLSGGGLAFGLTISF